MRSPIWTPGAIQRGALGGLICACTTERLIMVMMKGERWPERSKSAQRAFGRRWDEVVLGSTIDSTRPVKQLRGTFFFYLMFTAEALQYISHEHCLPLYTSLFGRWERENSILSNISTSRVKCVILYHLACHCLKLGSERHYQSKVWTNLLMHFFSFFTTYYTPDRHCC